MAVGQEGECNSEQGEENSSHQHADLWCPAFNREEPQGCGEPPGKENKQTNNFNQKINGKGNERRQALTGSQSTETVNYP